MEPSVIAAVINVTGVGLLGGVGFFLKRLYVRFDAFDKKFDAYDEKFDAYDEKIDKKFDAFEEKIDLKLDGLEERINLKLDALEERINLKLDALEERIEKLEEKVETMGVELRSELNSLKLAVGKIEFTQAHHSEQLAQIAGYSERISRLERAVFNAEG